MASLDKRTASAREVFAFKAELTASLGGEANLSIQRRKLVDLAARVSALLDHCDAWLLSQPSIINLRNRSLVPLVVQRQHLAGHLMQILDRLGLDRMPVKTETLASYVHQKYGSAGEPPSPSSSTAQPSTTEPS
jgi:hypothetical protein